ncbi:hypothetical protein [Nakamurella aerolata]|uniref:hypothetical protein n=1 Tax=Nakamurella aerolata TaxID=1656892 RepID=UPI001BB0EAE9|nr:hypothetical protein [Nakamurella aerolata]
MTLALVPLSMSTIGDLPEPCRHCAFWEIGPDGAALLADRSAAAFEKEVWLSGVSLTWGSAGLLVTVDERTAGYAIFAPPTTVPGAAVMPSGPVSPDAVLLTAARIDADFAGHGVGRFLLDGVVAALAGRGVRAVEAFGDEGAPQAEAGPDTGPDLTDPGLRLVAAEEHWAGTSGPVPCVLPAGFLRAVGFTEVQPHHRLPRLRYELSAGEHRWQAEVEAALDRLFTAAPARSAVVVQPALAGVCSRGDVVDRGLVSVSTPDSGTTG